MKTTFLVIVLALAAAELCPPPASAAQLAAGQAPQQPSTTPATPPDTDNGSSLPVSKSDVLAALKARGFTIEPLPSAQPREGMTGYREKDAPIALTFYERAGKLVVMFASINRVGSKKQGERAVTVVDALGEIVAGFTADEAKQATARALVDIGNEPTERQRLHGYANQRTIVRFVRRQDGGIGISFLPLPKVGRRDGRHGWLAGVERVGRSPLPPSRRVHIASALNLHRQRASDYGLMPHRSLHGRLILSVGSII